MILLISLLENISNLYDTKNSNLEKSQIRMETFPSLLYRNQTYAIAVKNT